MIQQTQPSSFFSSNFRLDVHAVLACAVPNHCGHSKQREQQRPREERAASRCREGEQAVQRCRAHGVRATVATGRVAGEGVTLIPSFPGPSVRSSFSSVAFSPSFARTSPCTTPARTAVMSALASTPEPAEQPAPAVESSSPASPPADAADATAVAQPDDVPAAAAATAMPAEPAEAAPAANAAASVAASPAAAPAAAAASLPAAAASAASASALLPPAVYPADFRLTVCNSAVFEDPATKKPVGLYQIALFKPSGNTMFDDALSVRWVRQHDCERNSDALADGCAGWIHLCPLH